MKHGLNVVFEAKLPEVLNISKWLYHLFAIVSTFGLLLPAFLHSINYYQPSYFGERIINCL